MVAYRTKHIIVGGAARRFITIPIEPSDWDPAQDKEFWALSLHWNNRGSSKCANDVCNFRCNGKKLTCLTAKNGVGKSSFTLFLIDSGGHVTAEVDIGRFLVSGSRSDPMIDE